ncbi:hypothetical protein ACWEFL_02790 [Streptomyces sp. NPDC004838]
MARLQILELPEGAADERAPFVLVIDEYTPQRVLLGGAQTDPWREHWEGVAARTGARAVLVFSERVDIPANALRGGIIEAGLFPESTSVSVEADTSRFEQALAEAGQAAGRVGPVQREVEHMDAVTTALGFDRLRDWGEIVEAIKTRRQKEAGGHSFGGPGHNDPVRCSRCLRDRYGWETTERRESCAEVLARRMTEGGHDFAVDPQTCRLCGLSRARWVLGIPWTCEEQRGVG